MYSEIVKHMSKQLEFLWDLSGFFSEQWMKVNGDTGQNETEQPPHGHRTVVRKIMFFYFHKDLSLCSCHLCVLNLFSSVVGAMLSYCCQVSQIIASLLSPI